MKFRRIPCQRKSFRRKALPDSQANADPKVIELVSLRVAQIHRSPVSIEMHKERLKSLGETDRQLEELETWTTSTLFSGRDRVALALCEEITQHPDQPVSGASVREMCQHFTKDAIISLTMAIMAVNDWTYLDGTQPFLR